MEHLLMVPFCNHFPSSNHAKILNNCIFPVTMHSVKWLESGLLKAVLETVS